MLRRVLIHRNQLPAFEVRRCLGSDPSAIISIMGHMWNMEKKANETKPLHAIQDGTSRYWDLGNSKNKYVCIGGTGPINLGDQVNVYQLIDFDNMLPNKLHIELLDCPKLLASKIMSAFPKLDIRSGNLRVIKLSYHRYSDQNKGQLHCTIVANHICKKLNEAGDFGFYSGNADTENAKNAIFYHNTKYSKTSNNEIHATINSKNGYIHINQLAADDAGIVYTDSDLSSKELKKWIKSIA